MAGSKPLDNPYLAHLPPSQRGAGPVASHPSVKEPLFGFLPRKVKGGQVRTAMVHISTWDARHITNGRFSVRNKI